MLSSPPNHRPQTIVYGKWKFERQHMIWFNRKFITMNTIEQFFVVKHLMILKQKRNVPVVAMSHHDREEQKWFYEAVVDCSNKRRQILSIPKSRKPSLENVFPWISFCFLQILVCSVLHYKIILAFFPFKFPATLDRRDKGWSWRKKTRAALYLYTNEIPTSPGNN